MSSNFNHIRLTVLSSTLEIAMLIETHKIVVLVSLQIMAETGKKIYELDRAEVWARARMNAKGELPAEAAEVQKKIVSLHFIN